MKTTKRLMSILLSLMLVLGAVAAGGMSASALARKAKLRIGDDTAIFNGEIKKTSGTGWTYEGDTDSGKLILDNLDLTYGGGNNCISAEYLDLTITGSAKLTATGTVSSAIYIYEGNLTLNGDFTLRAQCYTGSALGVGGSLTVEGGSLSVINTASDAISVRDAMTVNGGSVYAKTESSSDIAIPSGITLNNGEAFALGDEDAKEVLIKVPGQPPYITGDIIEYGTYPQSKVEDATLLASLNNLAPENFDDWTSYGYYYTESGTSTYGKMQPGDFMRYFDAVLDGVKYRAVFFTDYRPANTNCTYPTDYSLQTKNGYNTNTVYWFRFDPIEWRVLDPDEGFIVCNSVVDSQAYNNYILESDDEYYGSADKSYYANNYEKSSIRAWLNDDFINTAFSTSQQENIEETALNNDAYPESCSHYNSASTNDKVFLLSYAEATNSAYGFNSSASNYDTARWLRGSEYAKCQGLYVYILNGSGYEVNSFWHLRSPGDYSYDSCAVSNGGKVNNLIGTYSTDCGICPAMRLNELKSDPTGVPVDTVVEIPEGIEESYTDTEYTGVESADGYTLSGTVKATDAGEYTAVASLNEGYVWSDGTYEDKEISWKIKPRLIWYTMEARLDNNSFTYDGTAKEPTLAFLKDSYLDKELTEGVDYRILHIEWKNNINASDPEETDNEKLPTAVIEVEGMGNYYHSQSQSMVFEIDKAPLTITANDQTFAYNGETQGEGDTAYEGPGEKVTVEGLIAGDYLASIILDGQAKDIGEYPDSVVPSSARIKNSGGQDVTTNYNITYTAGKLTITSVNAPLTVNYVYAQGGEAAETHTEDVEIFTGYSVTSPEITGYTPDKETVEGTMENLDGVTENVTYTPVEFTATFVDENGETVEEVKFTVEDDSIDEPAVPEKEGYEGKWSEYTIAAGDMEITAQYTPIEYTAVFTADGETVAEIPYTVETESIEAPEVPAKEGFTGEWEEYELTPGGITVNAVYTENEPEDVCPLDNEDHGDGFFGRVRTFLHTLIWKAFRLLGLDVFFKVS